VSLGCYEQPEILDRIGYHPGPWIEKVTKKRLTVYRDDVRRQEAQILAPDPLRPGVYVGHRQSRGGLRKDPERGTTAGRGLPRERA